jgi:hypothetical protein
MASPVEPQASRTGSTAPPPTSALPSTGARVLAFASILLAGVCGGLIGWAITDLQCEGACATPTGVGTVVGAVIGAGGVAVIAVLGLRAMAEWKAIERQRQHGVAPDAEDARPRQP